MSSKRSFFSPLVGVCLFTGLAAGACNDDADADNDGHSMNTAPTATSKWGHRLAPRVRAMAPR